MNINSQLRKYGYRPNLSDGVFDKYEKVLAKYLDGKRYEDFCDLRDSASSEKEILKFIGDDVKFLKLALSAQIGQSITILNTVAKIIKQLDIEPEKILELGGADGWAIDFLQKQNHWNGNLYNVDENPIWKVKNEKIILVTDSYKNFRSDFGFDLIFSILGAAFDNLIELFQCIADNLNKNGTAILGLRIASEKEFVHSLKLADSLNLKVIMDLSTKIESQNEKFPILVLQRSDSKLTTNNILALLRNTFNLLEPAKRVNGIEAEYLLELIADGEYLTSTKKEWDNGDFMTVDVIKKNNINYRKTTNFSEDLIIEYPVELNDPYNIVENQLERMHDEYIFDNNK